MKLYRPQSTIKGDFAAGYDLFLFSGKGCVIALILNKTGWRGTTKIHGNSTCKN
jgi:hypothetical protein